MNTFGGIEQTVHMLVMGTVSRTNQPSACLVIRSCFPQRYWSMSSKAYRFGFKKLSKRKHATIKSGVFHSRLTETQ